MATASFHRLPRLHTYAQALSHYESVKPIRGRSPEVRPLGGRQDVDSFKIDKRGENIVCMLYQTDFLTFWPDNKITINIGAYKPSRADSFFIQAVLGLPACVRKGALVVPLSEKHTVLLNKDRRVLTIVRNEDGTLTPQSGYVVRGYVIDRAASNQVRKEYGEFYRYLKAVLSLRRDDAGEVAVTAGELKQILPTQTLAEARAANMDITPSSHLMRRWYGFDPTALNGPWRLFGDSIDGGYSPTDKKPGVSDQHRVHGITPAREGWKKKVAEFLELIKSGKDAQTMTDDFYKGFLWLAYWTSNTARLNGLAVAQYGYWIDDANAHRAVYSATPSRIRSAMDRLLFMYYANRVMRYVELDGSQVPNSDYAGWID